MGFKCLIWNFESLCPHVQDLNFAVELACVGYTRNENAHIYTKGKCLLSFLLIPSLFSKKWIWISLYIFLIFIAVEIYHEIYCLNHF